MSDFNTWYPLVHFNLDSAEELQKHIISWCASKNVSEQLTVLNARVIKRKLNLPAVVSIMDDDSFQVILNSRLSSEWNMGVALGHEIAHMYLYRNGVSCLCDVFTTLPKLERHAMHYQEEEFAESFGKAWARIGGNTAEAAKLHSEAEYR